VVFENLPKKKSSWEKYLLKEKSGNAKRRKWWRRGERCQVVFMVNPVKAVKASQKALCCLFHNSFRRVSGVLGECPTVTSGLPIKVTISLK